MRQLTCPIDGNPCDKNCPDRYRDTAEGGCILTTAQELGAQILTLDGGNVVAIYTPNN